MVDDRQLPPVPHIPESLRSPARHNPFGPRPGDDPAYLAGRADSLEDWAHPVRQLIDTGRSPGPIFFTAPRGLGKTVLLRHLQAEARQAQFVTAWLTAAESESLLAATVNGIKLSLQSSLPGQVDDLLARIDGFKISGGVPGLFRVELSSGEVGPTEVSFATEMAFMARTLRDRGARGLMLFVDELQSAKLADLAVLTRALQEWTSSGAPISFVGAGPIQLSRVLSSQAGFAERFNYHHLERLNELDALAALTQGRSADIEWLPGALDAAVAAAEGHPHVLQLIGHYAWKASNASKVAKPFFTRMDVDVAIADTLREIRQSFEGRWSDAGDAQRSVLGAVARSADQRLTRIEITRITSLSTRDAETAVDDLYADGWLDVDGLEQVRFGMPGVVDFVKLRAPVAESSAEAPKLWTPGQ